MTPTNAVAVGADLGGSKLAVGLVNPQGCVLQQKIVPTRASRGAAAVLEELATLVSELRGQAADQKLEVRGVGIATAGLVETDDGVLLATTEALPGFGGLHLKDHLQRLLACRVTVLNDVHAMAFGEVLFGAGRDADETLYVSVGTGIGGALTRGPNLLPGTHGFAGDIGHVVVDTCPNARRCPCGRSGHLEGYVSGPALASAYELRAGVTGLDGDLRPVSERANAGDIIAREVLTEGAHLLGRAVGGLVNLLDPELVVFGGGLISLDVDIFWGIVEISLRKELRGPYGPRLVRASLGTNAAIVGAAASALKADVSSCSGST